MRNILIIRFSSLGDIILTEPIVRVLKTTYPAARISYLTKEKYLPLLEMFSGIDTPIPLASESGLGELRNQLRKQKFDLVVDLHRNLRSRRVACSLTARGVTTEKEWLKRVARVKFKRLATSPRHALERYFTALEKLGIVPQTAPPRLCVPETAGNWWQNNSREAGISEGYYVIAAGAVHETKRAPTRLWLETAWEIRRSTEIAPLFVGSLEERSYLLEVARTMGLPENRVITEDDIRRSAAIIDGAAFTLSNDSGLSHLSAALGRPTLTLFGPTHPSLGFASLGPQASHYTVNEYCSPCSLHGKRRCYRQEPYCFTKMEPTAIAEKLRSLILLSSEKSGFAG